jgi:hypothetical protein
VQGDTGATGSAGPVGPVGPTGPAGANGVSGIQIVVVTSASSSSGKSITATCPAGKTIVGGGGSTSTSNAALTESAPGALIGGKATTWIAEAEEINSNSSNWTVTAQAICATG